MLLDSADPILHQGGILTILTTKQDVFGGRNTERPSRPYRSCVTIPIINTFPTDQREMERAHLIKLIGKYGGNRLTQLNTTGQQTYFQPDIGHLRARNHVMIGNTAPRGKNHKSGE